MAQLTATRRSSGAAARRAARGGPRNRHPRGPRSLGAESANVGVREARAVCGSDMIPSIPGSRICERGGAAARESGKTRRRCRNRGRMAWMARLAKLGTVFGLAMAIGGAASRRKPPGPLQSELQLGQIAGPENRGRERHPYGSGRPASSILDRCGATAARSPTWTRLSKSIWMGSWGRTSARGDPHFARFLH